MKFTVGILSLLITWNAQALIIDGVEVGPLVQALQEVQVKPASPLKFYHWFQAPERKPWNSELSAHAPEGFQFVQQSSQKFWESYGTPSSDFYGLGLYAAADPIFTHEYGGSNWVLVQIEIPKEFRALDLTLKSANSILSPSVKDTLKALQCEMPGSLQDLLKGGTIRTQKSAGPCNEALKRILREEMKIDGFFYSYGSAVFSECPGNFRNKALVLTDSKVLLPEMVQVLNQRTQDAKSERVTLQSLFYQASKALTSSLEKPENLEQRKKYIERIVLAEHPGYELYNIRLSCNKPCPPEVSVCKKGVDRTPENCLILPVPETKVQSYPEKFSTTQVPFVNKANLKDLLWKDLEGEGSDPGIESWIRSHLLCEPNQLTPL